MVAQKKPVVIQWLPYDDGTHDLLVHIEVVVRDVLDTATKNEAFLRVMQVVEDAIRNTYSAIS